MYQQQSATQRRQDVILDDVSSQPGGMAGARGLSFAEGEAAFAPVQAFGGTSFATGQAALEPVQRKDAGQQATAAPAPIDHPMLWYYSRGSDVMEMQGKLNAAGMADPGLKLDGVFGSRTAEAVRRFQRSRGLVADCICGPLTWAALDEVSGSRVFTTSELPAIQAEKEAADELRRAGAYFAALPLYLDLYHRPNIPPEHRGGITFCLGDCYQTLGLFEQAIGHYNEFLELPGGDEGSVADGLERIRECRAQKPPGELATRGGGPSEPADPAQLREQYLAAETLYLASDYKASRDAYVALYHRKDFPPSMRTGTTFHLAACEQQLGSFSTAISYYHEFLELPGSDEDALADAAERIRECRRGEAPGVLATQGGGPQEKEDKTEVYAIKRRADGLLEAEAWAAALKLYEVLYHRADMTPHMRGGTTFDIGACHHALGAFDEAISYYREFLQLPGGQGHMGKRDALQRIRECREARPPGTLETKMAKRGQVVDV